MRNCCINKKYARRRAKRNYMLRGLIRCAECDRAYVGVTSNSGSNAYYKCGKLGCPNRDVPAKLVPIVPGNGALTEICDGLFPDALVEIMGGTVIRQAGRPRDTAIGAIA